MNKKDFYYLGKITKTSGYKGSLMFFFDVDDASGYKNLEAVFVDLNDELIPFAIRQIQFKGNKNAFVTLEDVESDEQAEALVGYDLYLPLSYLPELKGDRFYYHEVIGFEVIDKCFGTVGTIDRFIEQGPQDMFVVKHDRKEVLIPVSDEIITKVNRENKTIEVDTPEGLIDIYL